jgi:hypothetical protein
VESVRAPVAIIINWFGALVGFLFNLAWKLLLNVCRCLGAFALVSGYIQVVFHRIGAVNFATVPSRLITAYRAAFKVLKSIACLLARIDSTIIVPIKLTLFLM